MKKLIEKKDRNQLKTQEICANFKIETHFQALQNTVVSNSEVYITLYYRLKIISTQNQITSKKLGHLDEKTAITVIYMCHSVKNYFSKSKSHSLNAAHDEKLLSFRKT